MMVQGYWGRWDHAHLKVPVGRYTYTVIVLSLCVQYVLNDACGCHKVPIYSHKNKLTKKARLGGGGVKPEVLVQQHLA